MLDLNTRFYFPDSSHHVGILYNVVTHNDKENADPNLKELINRNSNNLI